jgi:stage II sporulation protein AA (anti-sigma F factor antagonist)
MLPRFFGKQAGKVYIRLERFSKLLLNGGRKVQFNITVIGQALIATLDGDLDLHTCPQFKDALTKALDTNSNVKNLVFDVQNLTFIDSSGLGVILGRYRAVQARGGKLFFVKASPHMQRVLKLAGMHRISEFVDSTTEVLNRA